MSDEQSPPTGVKVIAVLYYISAVMAVILGSLFFIGGRAIGSIAGPVQELEAFGSILFIIGIVLIGLGVLSFFVGRGLWKARPWARVVAIIFAALGTLMAIISMIEDINVINMFSLVTNPIIGGYLLFSSDVKQVFA